jgi:hypothetical protein
LELLLLLLVLLPALVRPLLLLLVPQGLAQLLLPQPLVLLVQQRPHSARLLLLLALVLQVQLLQLLLLALLALLPPFLVLQGLHHPLEQLLQHQLLDSGHLAPSVLQQQQHHPLLVVLPLQYLLLDPTPHHHLGQLHQQQGLHQEQGQEEGLAQGQPQLLVHPVVLALVHLQLPLALELPPLGLEQLQQHPHLEQQREGGEEEDQCLGRVEVGLALGQQQGEGLGLLLEEVGHQVVLLVLLLLPLVALASSSSNKLEQQVVVVVVVLGCSSRGVVELLLVRQDRVGSQGLGRGLQGQHQGLGKRGHLGLVWVLQGVLGEGRCLGRQMQQQALIWDQQQHLRGVR